MSDAGFIIAVVVVVISAACLIWVWLEHAAWTRTLNRWGATYKVGRWEGEDNEHYKNRIYDRIDITGGKRNPW